MATIVLGAIGTFIGGPVGGLIGSAIGQSVDGAIFGSGKIEGPRLKELDIQTSNYGQNLPAIFGAMRVAGSVIWATDLKERKSTSGGGKGKPKSVEYSYSVNMAVALSSRPVARIGRIWAEGNLLRGASGDFKSSTEFRFYTGHDDQPLDPLIASAETAGACPAFRGTCYAVFEDFQLADFGNRIPSMTFELFERDTQVPINEIVVSASSETINCDSAELISGYALEGTDGRTALAPLLNNMPVVLRPKEDMLHLHDWWSPSLSSVPATQTQQNNGKEQDRAQRRRDPSGNLPKALAVRHYDISRDYQTGVQRSQLSDAGRIARQIDIPASLGAGAARRIADLNLLQLHKSQEHWTANIAVDENRPNAGDWVEDPDGDGIWQISEIEHFQNISRISARRSVQNDPDRDYSSDAGRNIASPDLHAGDTFLMLLDLPVINAIDPGQSILAVAAAGNGASWRSAALAMQNGAGLIDVGQTAAPATMGHVIGTLPAHSPHILDHQNQLIVELLNDNMQIPQGNGDPLNQNANLFWQGGEIIRAGQVDYLGENRYSLSHFQRGCFNTENYIDLHQENEKILLLESDTLRILESSPVNIGADIIIEAFGISDEMAVTGAIAVEGNAIKPPAPVHGQILLNAQQDLEVGWIRRTRINSGWADGVDIPLAEDQEAYNLIVKRDGLPIHSETITANHLLIGNAAWQGWNLPNAAILNFEIRQIGRFSQSEPLILPFQFP